MFCATCRLWWSLRRGYSKVSVSMDGWTKIKLAHTLSAHSQHQSGSTHSVHTHNTKVVPHTQCTLTSIRPTHSVHTHNTKSAHTLSAHSQHQIGPHTQCTLTTPNIIKIRLTISYMEHKKRQTRTEYYFNSVLGYDAVKFGRNWFQFRKNVRHLSTVQKLLHHTEVLRMTCRLWTLASHCHGDNQLLGSTLVRHSEGASSIASDRRSSESVAGSELCCRT
jgi:hypothetical protein